MIPISFSDYDIATLDTRRRTLVIEEAFSWIGTPFHHQGTVKGPRGGVGCGTFLTQVFSSVGIHVPDPKSFDHFSLDWHLHTHEERYLRVLEQFARYTMTPKPGDVAIFRLGRVYSHSAIIAEWPSVLIHSHWRSKVEITDATRQPLLGRPYVFMTPYDEKRSWVDETLGGIA